MKNNNEEEEVRSKIISIDKQINDDLCLIPEYKLLTIYSKLSKIIKQDERKYLILRNKFIFIDKTLTGYINLKDFYDILNNNLPLEKDELKLLLCDPALRNKINPNLYQYKPFFDLIRRFEENELLKMKQEYNIEQNPYIIKLKKEIKNKKIDLKKSWENSFKNGALCTKDNFYLLFVEMKLDNNLHKLEIEYIFEIICKIGENNIKFEYFKDVMNKKSVPDIRIIYFKGLKEFKNRQLENKEKTDNLLINYYPNLLENNNNINSTENSNENTKYLVIKGEEIINNEENSNIEERKNTENFIVGNKSDEYLQNLEEVNSNRKKDINSITGTLEISESLVIKAKPKINENQQINEEENNKNKETNNIIYKKYYPNVYDVDNNNNKEKCNSNKIYDEKLTKIEQKNIINNKIKDSLDKVNKLLEKHEEYIILRLYLSLKNQLILINEDILLKFSNKDPQCTKYLSLNDFISILKTELKMNFDQEEFILLLNSLRIQNNENTLFSYEEFINNINNETDKYKERLEAIKSLALINFNTYILELKKLIVNNNIDIDEIFNAFSRDKINMNLNNFILLLQSLRYDLIDMSEYKFLFNIISKHAEKKNIFKKDLISLIHSETISEEKFISDGKIVKNFRENHKKFWYKFIPEYDHKKRRINGIEKFEFIFEQINKQKVKYGIINLADLFSSIYDFNINGNITKEQFINTMKTLDINNIRNMNDLLFYFEDSNDKNNIRLFIFLGIFKSFFPIKNNRASPPYNFKIYPKDPNIVFRNNYGVFTSFDLAKIKALCLSINEKITFIKRQNINNYFNKFDVFQRGFLLLEQLKAILIDDLNIQKKDLIDLFLCYILDNNKKNDNFIIYLTKLIEIINKFIDSKDETEQLNIYNTFSYTNEVFNKLMNSTIMNIRLNKKENSNYNFSLNAGID